MLAPTHTRHLPRRPAPGRERDRMGYLKPPRPHDLLRWVSAARQMQFMPLDAQIRSNYLQNLRCWTRSVNITTTWYNIGNYICAVNGVDRRGFTMTMQGR